MNLLSRRLLLPLASLSLLSLVIAYLLDPALDFSSIFLNLTTDLIMVILTVYYVDEILKKHEEENSYRANYSVYLKLANETSKLLEKLCVPLGAYENELIMEMGPKLYNPRGTPNPAMFFYFTRRLSKMPFPDAERVISVLTEDQKSTILQDLREFATRLQGMIDLYGHRLPPELFRQAMETQDWIDSYMRGPTVDPLYLRSTLIHLVNLVEATKTDGLHFYMDISEFREEFTGRKYPSP